MASRQKSTSRLHADNQQNVRELNTLHAATVALLNTIELDVLLDQVLTVALRSIPIAERGLLLIADQAAGQMQIRSASGYTDERLRPDSFFRPAGFLAKAVRERTPLLISDAHGDLALQLPDDIPELRSIQSAIVAPLLLGDQILGVLSLDSTERQVFDDSDLRLLAAFAATASVAIRNAQLYAQVQRQAITDHLTGLYNRRGFFELGQRELERVRRFKHPLSAILFDLDRFKQINDTFGHPVGDQVIYAVAERCRRNLRHIDILARYGGEEFAVLLPETDLPTAYQVAERLRQSIADTPVETERGSIPMTISVGMTMATEDTPDLATLLNRADAAMYSAKQMGGEYLVVH
jgi:diguanylate cyclase (GGDEF)-like protein